MGLRKDDDGYFILPEPVEIESRVDDTTYEATKVRHGWEGIVLAGWETDEKQHITVITMNFQEAIDLLSDVLTDKELDRVISE